MLTSTVKLFSNGIDESTVSHSIPDWLQVNLPISQVESLLQTKYSLFRDLASNTTVARTNQYSIPQLLHGHIDIITPT
jgi:tripeptidyl-peptidase-1